MDDLMPLHRFPDHVISRADHPFQTTLNLLDADLRLAWNTRLDRWEIYKPRLTPSGVFWDMIERVTGPDGRGTAEPGEWLIRRLRERDARHNPNAWKTVQKELHADEQKALDEDDKRLDDTRADLIETYIPLWQQKADDSYTGKRFYRWDPEPVAFSMPKREWRVERTTKQREAIRQEARS